VITLLATQVGRLGVDHCVPHCGINVPTGVLAIVVALRVLRDTAPRQRRRMDFLGMSTLGLGLFAVLWAMTKLASESFDAPIAGYLIGGIALIGVFVVIEARVAEPMLPLSIFRAPTIGASLLPRCRHRCG
jgi:hypothetical protein